MKDTDYLEGFFSKKVDPLPYKIKAIPLWGENYRVNLWNALDEMTHSWFIVMNNGKIIYSNPAL